MSASPSLVVAPTAPRADRRVVVSANVVAGIAVGVAMAAFVAYRLWQAFTGDPVLWTDTADYARSAVWAGPRPPLVPLLLGVAGTSNVFVAVQVIVGIVAWVALAAAVAMLVSSVTARALVVTLVLAFASTTAVVRWDRSVLSESLSMSTLALLLAALLWYAHGAPSWPRVLGLIAPAALFASARDPHVWVVWLLAAVIGIDAVVRARGVRGVVAALGLALCAGALLGGSLAADRTDVNLEHVYAVRVFPYADRVDWFADHGMPSAQWVDELAASTTHEDGVAPVVGLDANDPAAQSLLTWVHDHGAATYARWLLEHPVTLVTEPMRLPERAYNFADGDLDFYSAPGRTEVGLLDALLTPAAAVVVVVAIGAVVVGAIARRWRVGWWWMLVAFGALGVVHALVAWHGDGMETTRHVTVGDVQARLAVLVLAAVAVERLASRRRDRTPDHDNDHANDRDPAPMDHRAHQAVEHGA